MTKRSQNTRNRNARRRPIARRAFTLIEVIVAVTIVALLATMVVPTVFGLLTSSTRKIAQAEVNTIHRQVELYVLENTNGSLPNDFALTELTTGSKPLLHPDDLIDPWENPYVILVPPEYNFDFDIVSFGEDGQPGGDEDDADLVSNQETKKTR
jgi:general secretion pathway protein G